VQIKKEKGKIKTKEEKARCEPETVPTEVVEPIVPLPCFFALFFFLDFLLYFFCFFFAQGKTNRGNLCRPIEMGGRKMKRVQQSTGRAAPHSGVRDAYSGAAVLLTSLSRQADNADRSQKRESLSSRPAAETRIESKERRRKKNLRRLGLGKNKRKKHRDQQRK
jgi:hypothetical protein